MEVLAPLVFVPSLALSLYKKTWIWPSRLILIAFGGLLATYTASSIANNFTLSQFLDSIGEFRWMIAYIGFLQFFHLFHKQINYQKLLFFAQCVLIIGGFYSFYQFFTGHDFFRPHVQFNQLYEGSKYWRPNSFFGLPTTFGYASTMLYCISLCFWFREKRKAGLTTHVTQFYFFISAFCIFLTFTRAAWIAFVCSTLPLLFLIDKKMCLRALAIFIIFISAFYTSMPSFQHRLQSIFDNKYIANHTRIYLWKANLDMFKQNPILGVGFEENKKRINEFLDPYNVPEINMRQHPHSTYISFLSGLGILGLFFLLLYMGTNMTSSIKGFYSTTHPHHKTLYLALLGAQIVMLVGGITECNFEDLELNHQYTLYVALIEYLRQQDFPA